MNNFKINRIWENYAADKHMLKTDSVINAAV